MILSALYHGLGAVVVHAEALVGLAISMQMIVGGVVEKGVFDNSQVFLHKTSLLVQNNDGSASMYSQGNVFVGLSSEAQLQSWQQKGTKELPG